MLIFSLLLSQESAIIYVEYMRKANDKPDFKAYLAKEYARLNSILPDAGAKTAEVAKKASVLSHFVEGSA